jgi:hypothetical protein
MNLIASIAGDQCETAAKERKRPPAPVVQSRRTKEKTATVGIC